MKKQILGAAILAMATLAHAQFEPAMPEGAPKPAANVKPDVADKDVEIIAPKVDKQNKSITLAASFWNQGLAGWVEVAFCGRPSDFLHETIIAATTTRENMLKAMREAGFVDADHWVGNVSDFPRIRGDKAAIILDFEVEGKKQTFLLDELIAFQGWGVSPGPHGWLFKGDPARDMKKEEEQPQEKLTNRQKILRDAPQVALQFKGLQHMSQSFLDFPLAYDDWILPAPKYMRNFEVLSEKAFNANLELPVVMTIKKVSEAEFIELAAKLWHDAKAAEHIKKQLPTAKQIDEDKAALWVMLPELRKLAKLPDEQRDVPKEVELFGKSAVLAASIEAGYAALDLAWATWASENPVITTKDARQVDEISSEIKKWREHRELQRERAEHLLTAETAAFEAKKLGLQTQTEEVKAKTSRLRGEEIRARSLAQIAENKHVRKYWRYEKSRLNPSDDPRTDWIRHVTVQAELVEARHAMAETGVALGTLLAKGETNVKAVQERYRAALSRVTLGQMRLELADVEFEISKREGFEEDAELRELKKRRAEMQAELKKAEAATQPK